MTAPASPPTESSANLGADDAAPANSPETREGKARAIVKRNAYWALGTGLIPLPVIDFLAQTAVQIKMLKEISDVYGVEFFDDKAKKIIGSLIAGIGSLSIAGALASSFAKVVPGLGSLVGIVGVPVVSGALTLAIGNLFVMHYESGGTLLDFDSAKMRDHFNQEFEKGKRDARQLKREDRDRTDGPRQP